MLTSGKNTSSSKTGKPFNITSAKTVLCSLLTLKAVTTILIYSRSTYLTSDFRGRKRVYLRIIVLLFFHSVFRLRDTSLLKSARRW